MHSSGHTPQCRNGCNRLAGEKSPYLRQHAANPVHWHPWGEFAIQEARRLDRPVFLSIGYSTCHWCHVMAHESFEDPETARLLNDTFVCIKVDREERPDIDSIYMTACHLLTGSGGWPLTIVMTPDRKPFFAATYLPRHSRFGRIGLQDLTTRIGSLWESRREELDADAGRVTAALQQTTAPEQGDPLRPHLADQAAAALQNTFDDRHGGFGAAPKFPSPHTLSFLLRHGHRTGNTRSYDMVRTTLQAMRGGGIYDCLGFGLHRYATDAAWLVPHFEKMLYDQALLATTCAETYQATGDAVAARMAREVCAYVLRDLTAPEGGFYAAEDADSEGVEGKFYLWAAAEIDVLLTPDEADVFKRACNVTPQGNFCDEATGQPTGANILHQAVPLSILAGELNRPEDELALLMASAREKLLHCRNHRVRPHRDEKILTDWNGMMIAALAVCGRTFDDAALLQAATRACAFVLETLCGPDNRLLHRYCDGQTAGSGLASDYACLIWALLELYQSTFSPAWLEKALALNRVFVARFRDSRTGGFFTAADDAGDVIVRQKEFTDGALPSPNAVALYNLLRLGRITGDSAHDEMAALIGRACSPVVSRNPQHHTFMLCALETALAPSREIIIAGDPAAPDTCALLRVVRSRFLPGATIVLHSAGTDAHRIEAIAPHLRAFEPPGGRATAWVCTNFTCDRPVQDPETLGSLLE